MWSAMWATGLKRVAEVGGHEDHPHHPAPPGDGGDLIVVEVAAVAVDAVGAECEVKTGVREASCRCQKVWGLRGRCR
jgi:hypothetical protein